MSIRPVQRIVQSKPTIEGAGVKLHRAFGFGETTEFDPFLLFDDFRNDRPDDYRAGFPWHPHRGIETITYVLAGTVEHGDSLGNKGRMGAGDVQWMTAGSGILHQEMPKGDDRGRMHGFQLWANLPVVAQDDGAALSGHSGDRHSGGRRRRRHARAGDLRRVLGQAAGRSTASRRSRAISTSPFRRASARRCRSEPARHAFAYVFDGSGTFRDASQPFGVLTEKASPTGDILVREQTGNRSLVLFDSGDEVTVQAGEQGIRFLLVSGQPIEEPVAWYGPIVMNTKAELQQAVTELRNGTFIKHG